MNLIMEYVALPTLAISLAALFDILSGGLNDWKKYYYLFIAVLIAKFLLFSPTKAVAETNDEYRVNSRLCEVTAFMDVQFKSSSNGEMALIHLHAYNKAMKKYDAMCMFVPSKSDKAIADNLFVIAISTLAANDPKSKMINAACVFITQYGLDVAEEWREIQRTLYLALHHLELYEFYSNLLHKESQQ